MTFGDRYDWACALRWLDHETVELSGVLAFPHLAIRKAIRIVLEPLGMRTIVFDRYKGPFAKKVIMHIEDNGRETIKCSKK